MAPVFQYSTASALMAGVAAHGITVADLLKHGRYGLGTMLGIDGEVVVANGTVYHLCDSGKPSLVGPDARLPFAMVADIDPAHTGKCPGVASKDALVDAIRRAEPDAGNKFIAFRAHGTIDYIRVRVVRGQKYPDQPLAELGDSQRVHEFHGATGTLIGFITPAYLAGVSIAGLHVHFLSDDCQAGGHLLEIATRAELCTWTRTIGELDLQLPDSHEFARANLNTDNDALRRVEG